MRPIVKDSFFEGRKTDVSWLDSESRKLEKDIEASSFRNRKVAQIDKNNGSIVNVFRNVRHAKYHAVKILNGNINQFKLAVLSNWRCGGYEWDLLELGAKNEVTKYYDNCDVQLYAIIEQGSVKTDLTKAEVDEYMNLGDRYTLPKSMKSRNGKIVISMKDYDINATNKVNYAQYFKREFPYTVVDLENNKTKKYKNISSIVRDTALSISRHDVHKLLNYPSYKHKYNKKNLHKKYNITKEDY